MGATAAQLAALATGAFDQLSPAALDCALALPNPIPSSPLTRSTLSDRWVMAAAPTSM